MEERGAGLTCHCGDEGFREGSGGSGGLPGSGCS